MRSLQFDTSKIIIGSGESLKVMIAAMPCPTPYKVDQRTRRGCFFLIPPSLSHCQCRFMTGSLSSTRTIQDTRTLLRVCALMTRCSSQEVRTRQSGYGVGRTRSKQINYQKIIIPLLAKGSTFHIVSDSHLGE